MDHLLENEGKPVPDLSGVSDTSSSRPSGGGDQPMDEDDDEDTAALRAVYGGSGAAAAAAAAADVEAKVRLGRNLREGALTSSSGIEHQVFTMRKDIQEYFSCELSRGKEWPRPV